MSETKARNVLTHKMRTRNARCVAFGARHSFSHELCRSFRCRRLTSKLTVHGHNGQWPARPTSKTRRLLQSGETRKMRNI